MLDKKILFFDIETHYVIPFDEISDELKDAFRSHGYDETSSDPIEEQYKKQAGLIPEFGHIICVSLGYEDRITGEFHTVSISGTDEEVLLRKLAQVLAGFEKQGYVLAGFNSNGFDIPYLSKHYIMHGMKLPNLLNNYGKKPWEITNIDVMNEWKLGGWGSTSLQVAAACLGIASKTESISGRNMWTIPIEDMDWKELEKYCEEDTFVTYKIHEILAECIF